MNPACRLMVMMCAVMMLAGPALAEKKNKAAASQPAQKSSLRGSHAAWADRAGLDETQREQIATANKMRGEAMKAISPKIVEARQKIKAAQESGDQAAIDAAKAEMRALNQERRKLQSEFNDILHSTLKPDQLVKWEGGRLSHGAMMRYRKADLTDAQKQTIDTKADEAAAKLVEIDTNDNKAKKEVIAALHQDIIENVLTDAQREAVPKRKSKAKGASEKPKRKGRKKDTNTVEAAVPE